MSKPPTSKTKTRPGLGSKNGLPRVSSTEMKRVVLPRGEGPDETTPPAPTATVVSSSPAPPRVASRVTVRREEEDDELIPSNRSTSRRISWGPEAPSGTHAKPRSERPAVAVDQVGDTAVELAQKSTQRESAPKLVASRGGIAGAPIDSRTAFVLSLVDGRNTTAAIVDMSGMPEAEVKVVLARLARLGLISLS